MKRVTVKNMPAFKQAKNPKVYNPSVVFPYLILIRADEKKNKIVEGLTVGSKLIPKSQNPCVGDVCNVTDESGKTLGKVRLQPVMDIGRNEYFECNSPLITNTFKKILDNLSFTIVKLEPLWTRRKGSKYSNIYVAIDYVDEIEIEDVVVEEITKDDLSSEYIGEFDNNAIFPEDHLSFTNWSV